MHLRDSTLVLVVCLFVACAKDEGKPYESGRPAADTWLVPKDEVVDAGPGKDGIPSVDQPQFDHAADVNPAFDDDLVLGVAHEGTFKAYPVPMLNWHEIINDEVNGLPIAVTYCPLTGTGLGWSRRVHGAVSTFGVSGLLYNNNLMPYDRRTNSTWSQLEMKCVNGFLIGEAPTVHPLIETTFSTWKKCFPDSEVMNARTGFDRRYSEYPYRDYRTNQDLLFFPLNHTDGRLPAKERVLGVIAEEAAKVFRFNAENADLEIIVDLIGDQKVLVVRSDKHQIFAAFYPEEGRSYQILHRPFPGIFQDDQGTVFSLSGHSLGEERSSKQLSQPLSFMGFWFSWGAFYPNIEIYPG